MASTPTPANNTNHVRSISLPSRSHPLSVRVEEGLNRLKTWAASALLVQAASPTAELLCVGLQALEEMYDCVEELLRLPHTQLALARQQHENWAGEELDTSVRLLDICGTTRDSVLSMKEQAQNLQSALRTRRVGEHSAVRGQIHAFVHSRKKVQKEGSRCLKALKQMGGKQPAASPVFAADGQDLSLALKALGDLREITIIVFRSISCFMTSKPVIRRWLPSPSRTREGEQSTSELEKVEASLWSIHKKHSGKDADFEKKVEEAQKGLEGLDFGMGGLETGLASMFRRLIQSRVSLLNILSL